jgi:SnoaL-like polyketide cyclase
VGSSQVRYGTMTQLLPFLSLPQSSTRGMDEIGAYLDRLFTAEPDFSFDVSNGSVAGDRAVAEWTVSGTYSNDFPELPPAAVSASRSGAPRSSSSPMARSTTTPSIETPISSWCSSGQCRHPGQRGLQCHNGLRAAAHNSSRSTLGSVSGGTRLTAAWNRRSSWLSPWTRADD